jgi:putative transposase
MAGMSFAIALTDEQWELVADLFDPVGRRGAPAQIPRRQMVEAILFLARTGCQWRYLPERYGSWRRSGPSGGAGGRTASGRRR